ncbi:hypothetical protein [Aestuariibius sp. HNIBRBA575]|uniref:hypothetical protein n=1 Tax=Aestuariibius sp. HNIBRBA575 TaxID=3233343 RepID=UPI0034A53BB5
MSDIAELESRLTAALDRIRNGIEAMPDLAVAAPADTSAQDEMAAKITELEAKLDEERVVNSQLEERVKALKERQDTLIADLTSEAEDHRGAAAKALDESQRLRALNADLRGINEKLRDAMIEDIAEPHLINKAMLAELEALRATRAADMTEVDVVMGELRQLITEQESA